MLSSAARFYTPAASVAVSHRTVLAVPVLAVPVLAVPPIRKVLSLLFFRFHSVSVIVDQAAVCRHAVLCCEVLYSSCLSCSQSSYCPRSSCPRSFTPPRSRSRQPLDGAPRFALASLLAAPHSVAPSRVIFRASRRLVGLAFDKISSSCDVGLISYFSFGLSGLSSFGLSSFVLSTSTSLFIAIYLHQRWLRRLSHPLVSVGPEVGLEIWSHAHGRCLDHFWFVWWLLMSIAPKLP